MPTPPRLTTASTPSRVPSSIRPGRRVPAALVRGGGGPAHQAQHLVPGLPQVGDQGGSDQAGRTGHDDAHGGDPSEPGVTVARGRGRRCAVTRDEPQRVRAATGPARPRTRPPPAGPGSRTGSGRRRRRRRGGGRRSAAGSRPSGSAITSSPSGPGTTFGSLRWRRYRGSPTCGWLMIGVSNSAPGAADVGDRERAAGQLVRADLVVAGAGRHVGDLLGEPGDARGRRVLDHRDEQAARGVHGDAPGARRRGR